MSDNTLYEIANDVLKNSDIVEVISSRIKVMQAGRNYKAVCPFHDDSNPSLMISRDKQIFKCFVCGEGGNAINFIQKYDKVNYFEALKEVAKISGYNDPRLDNLGYQTKKQVNPDLVLLYNCLTDINNFYQTSLFQSEAGKKGLAYLKKRQIDEETIRYFSIGYSLDDGTNIINFLKSKQYSIKTIERAGIGRINTNNMTIRDSNAGRVIFPIKNADGQVVGFSARRINDNQDEAKYINTSSTIAFNKGDILYNLDKAKDEARRKGFVYLLEGFMDVIALYRIGIKNAIALMGTALTDDHIKEIRKLNCEVRICLDLDHAGQDHTLAIIEKFDAEVIPYKIVNQVVDFTYKDSDEILNNLGKERLERYLNNLIEKGEWLLNYYSQNLNLNNNSDKKKLVTVMMKEIIKLKNEFDVEDYIMRLSRLTGYSRELLYEYYGKITKRKIAKNDDPLDDYGTIKFTKSMSKLDRYQQKLVYYMLKEKGALELYFENNVFLPNASYRAIVRAIQDYLERGLNPEPKIDIQSLINYISTVDVSDKDEIIKNLTEFEMDMDNKKKFNYPEYTEAEFKNTLESLQKHLTNARNKESLNSVPLDQREPARNNYLAKKAKL